MQLSRLRGRKTAEMVLRKGKVWKGKVMVIRYLTEHPQNLPVDRKKSAVYVGTLASAKLNKSAVKRNRMRRRCREAMRKTLKDYKDFPTLQLLIAPRSSSLTCAHGDIQKDISRFLSLFS